VRVVSNNRVAKAIRKRLAYNFFIPAIILKIIIKFNRIGGWGNGGMGRWGNDGMLE